MRRLSLLAVVLVLTACGSEAPEPPEPTPPGALEHALEQAQDGNFTLYVSNQSFERGNVDMRIWLDGLLAVDDRFAVENQHNWVEFRFRLADGPHSLRAKSADGEATLEERFEVTGKRWAVVDYWCCAAHAGEPKFTFTVSDGPIAFA